MASTSKNPEPKTLAPGDEDPKTLAPDAPEPAALNPSVVDNGKGEAAKEEEAEDDEEEEVVEQTLAQAEELFDKGSKAIEDGDFVEAVDCLSQALEIRVVHYGELAEECASSYYKYGSALLFKAQEETDPLGSVPKNNPRVEKVNSMASTAGSGTSRASASNAGDNEAGDDDKAEGSKGKGRADDNDGSDRDDDLAEPEAEADEDESDLDLAWKMLDIARAIAEKNPEDNMDKVKIYSALAEVSMEREDIENSLNDYLRALSILEKLVEPDHRRVVELNFRICLLLELGSKLREAVPYCAKAITLCKSRIEKLKNGKEGSAVVQNGASAEGGAGKTGHEDEIQLLSGILSDLEKKLEDLEQPTPDPSSVVSDVMKMIASKITGEKSDPTAVARSASLTSSQMAAVHNGFDSPAASTATTVGNTVTNLGVVGRGVKRATIKPCVADPAPKKPMLDSSAEKGDSSTSEVLAPAPMAHDRESSNAE